MAISSKDHLWADLINSDWRDYRGSGAREDRLFNDSWLASFLSRAGWDDGLPERKERIRLRQLRSFLRRMVIRLMDGGTLEGADLRRLNRFLAAAPVITKLEPHGPGWRLSQACVKPGFGRVSAAIALSFASMLAEGDPTRIKICANPDCGWVLYDESHNRTRRWCDVRECGNLIKVRRFRERKRSASHAR